MIIQITTGFSIGPELQKELLKTVDLLWGPREEKKMKYWEVTAHTGYCGEELVGFIAVKEDSEDELYRYADALMVDCAAEWAPDFESEYEDYGYESPEDYEEAYLADCGCTYREVTKEEYEKAIAEGF